MSILRWEAMRYPIFDGAFSDTETFRSRPRAWIVVERFSGNQENYIKT